MLSPHRVALRVIQHINFAMGSIRAACSLSDEHRSINRKRKFINNFAMIPFVSWNFQVSCHEILNMVLYNNYMLLL